MHVREATPEDWPAIWAFMRRIVAAGDTYCWPVDTAEAVAYTRWMKQPPGRTVVAVEGTGTQNSRVVGTAETEPNQGGPGSHVANASFMVDPDHAGRGIGRALAEHVLTQAKLDGYQAMQFNAVVETNTSAVALWESLGFEVLTTVPEAFRHPQAGLVGLHIMYRQL